MLCTPMDGSEVLYITDESHVNGLGILFGERSAVCTYKWVKVAPSPIATIATFPLVGPKCLVSRLDKLSIVHCTLQLANISVWTRTSY